MNQAIATRVGGVPLKVSIVFAVFSCAGCAVVPSTSRDEYRAIFSDVIRKSFSETKTNNVCLPVIFGPGDSAPDYVEVNLDNGVGPTYPMVRLPQLTALVSVGLLDRTDSERSVGNRTTKFATFKRTPKGATFFSNGAFCYARAELDSVVKWKGPVVLGEYRAAWVYYTTRTVSVADWANAPTILSGIQRSAPCSRARPQSFDRSRSTTQAKVGTSQSIRS